MSLYDDYRRALLEHGQPLPQLLLDLDALDANIAAIKTRAQGLPVRVASKSIRSRWVLRYILDADPIFQGIMAFHLPEAVALLEAGFKNILVGYPSSNAAAIAHVCQAIAQHGPHIRLMVDSAAHVEQIATIAAQYGVQVPLCVDVDVSVDVGPLHFGVWRSPIQDAAAALRLYRHIEKHAEYVVLQGVMGYEAQIAGVTDAMPGQSLKNRLIRWLKRRSIPTIAERRGAVVAALKAAGAALQLVNGGGTASIESTRQDPSVSEITVGSGFFAPALFDHYQHFQHRPALFFALEIARQAAPDIFTLHGGGYIASGAVGGEKAPSIYLPTGAQLMPLEGAGEVQTPIRYRGAVGLKVGAPVFLRHAKAGEICERLPSLLLLRGGAIVDEVPTYRREQALSI